MDAVLGATAKWDMLYLITRENYQEGLTFNIEPGTYSARMDQSSDRSGYRQ